MTLETRGQKVPLHCSFCGKSQREVFLIAGPTVFICEECVDLCNEVVERKRKGSPGVREYESWF